MGKNSAGSGLLALTVALAACTAPGEQPPGFQGIVEHELRTVAAESAGRVDDVLVRRGDAVLPGDVLVVLDDSLGRLSVDVREAEVDIARADLALLSAGSRREDVAAVAAQLRAAKAGELNAERGETRARELFAAGALPRAELDRAEAEAQRAKGERQSLEARLGALARGARPEELARAEARTVAAERATALEAERVDRSTVRSLVAGTVIDRLVEPGELAGIGMPLVTLADLDHPYAEVFVPQNHLAGVAVGRAAVLRVDATTETFHGQVEWISPHTEFTPRYIFSPRERQSLVVRVRIRIEDAAHALHAGVPAFVELAP